MLPWGASSLARVGAIGRHIFYRWTGRLERALAFRQSYAGVEPAVGAAPSPPEPVLVHRGGEAEQGGVAIHRGASAPELAHEGEDAPAEVAPTALAGVRGHYGAEGDAG